MSALLFYFDAQQVLLATDTLAVLDNGQPFLYTTKVFPVPHLRMLIAGTGIGHFVGPWFLQVNDGMLVRDVDHLDHHTPGNLQRLWERHKQTLPFPARASVTVYHFGFAEADNLIHAYAYRSTEGFRSERYAEYGFGVKPAFEVPGTYTLPKDIRSMMDAQRTAQAALSPDERVSIGGDIQVHHLTAEGYHIYRHDRFPEYEQDTHTMYAFHDQQRHSTP